MISIFWYPLKLIIYLKSSVRWTVESDNNHWVELIIMTVLNAVILYLNYVFNPEMKEDTVNDAGKYLFFSFFTINITDTFQVSNRQIRANVSR